MGLRGVVVLVGTLLGAALVGCLDAPDAAPTAPRDDPVELTFRVVNATTSKPVFMAHVAVVDATTTLVVVSTDINGTAKVDAPPTATGFVVEAPGYAPKNGSLAAPADVVEVRLEPLSRQIEELARSAGLRFRTPVDLGSYQYPVAVGTSCMDLLEDRDGDCGLGEPQVEVDGAGTIYVSGVCCIGAAPPVYVSRDDGYTFELLTTPTGVREAFGIEGDFAIDAKGVVYFADIELAATFQVTAWDAQGNYIHHTKWPAPPLVDRDWIRAHGDGELYYVYNTGGSTNVYTSTDGGRTWSPVPVYTAGYGLGTAVAGLDPGELWVLGGSCDGSRCADYTTDGGATWTQETTSAPAGGSFPVGFFDEAGEMYVVSGASERVQVARRDMSGTWHEPVDVAPAGGHHRMPWLSAGGPGKVVVAWYGTLDDEITASTPWYLFVAATVDGAARSPAWQVAIADPEPVFVGALGRDLLDFLQVEVGPDGAVHVAYSKVRAATGNEEQMHYVHSVPTLPLAPSKYFWGP